MALSTPTRVFRASLPAGGPRLLSMCKTLSLSPLSRLCNILIKPECLGIVALDIILRMQHLVYGKHFARTHTRIHIN